MAIQQLHVECVFAIVYVEDSTTTQPRAGPSYLCVLGLSNLNDGLDMTSVLSSNQAAHTPLRSLLYSFSSPPVKFI